MDISNFPETFRFGVADSDLQVIGEANARLSEGSYSTAWSVFAEHSEHCHDSPATGINRYQLWEQDISLMRSLGCQHYRTSISMARLLMKDGSVNGKAVEWYRAYFSALRAAGRDRG